MSWVLNEPGQKSTHIEICKKISIQPCPNSWWARLAHGFQPILRALIITIDRMHNLLEFVIQNKSGSYYLGVDIYNL